jgi:hypothetical protein
MPGHPLTRWPSRSDVICSAAGHLTIVRYGEITSSCSLLWQLFCLSFEPLSVQLCFISRDPQFRLTQAITFVFDIIVTSEICNVIRSSAAFLERIMENVARSRSLSMAHLGILSPSGRSETCIIRLANLVSTVTREGTSGRSSNRSCGLATDDIESSDSSSRYPLHAHEATKSDP